MSEKYRLVSHMESRFIRFFVYGCACVCVCMCVRVCIHIYNMKTEGELFVRRKISRKGEVEQERLMG